MYTLDEMAIIISLIKNESELYKVCCILMQYKKSFSLVNIRAIDKLIKFKRLELK